MKNEYGSQEIQPKGRIFEIGEEAGSVQTQHGQGAGGKIAKRPCKHCGGVERSNSGACPTCYESRLERLKAERAEEKIKRGKKRRPTFNCKLCGTEKEERYGEKNEFCSHECHNEFSVSRWIKCSQCLAEIGLGSKRTGRVLGISSSSVTRQWKRRRIIAEKVMINRSAYRNRCHQQLDNKRKDIEAMREYEIASLRSIRDSRRFPDWSSVWEYEKLLRYQRAKYQELTEEEKKVLNKNSHLRRMACPIRRQKVRDKVKEWRSRNPEKSRSFVRNSIKKRKAIDPGFRVQCNLRNRLKDLMHTTRNGGANQISELIGCTTQQLARHLEAGFKRGMSWANYGIHWHVDHILPCSSFDHTNPQQVKQCWHYSNLRPLEAFKNLAKSALITEPQMQLLLCSTH